MPERELNSIPLNKELAKAYDKTQDGSEIPKNQKRKTFFEEAYELNKDIDFNEAISSNIYHHFNEREIKTINQYFIEQNISIPIEACPWSLPQNVKNFNLQDWQFIQSSKDQLVSIYAVNNYYEDYEKLCKDNISIEDEAYIRSLPLVHGTSFGNLEILMEYGNFLSNRGVYETQGKNAEEFTEEFQGTTTEDRKIGLDKYIFTHFGRMDSRYSQQEITLVLDPGLLEQEGSFATEQDYLDYFSIDNPLDAYVSSISKAPYFYKQAISRINHTTVGEKRSGGSYKIDTNTLRGFIEGVDEERNNVGQIRFSTWEIKLPNVKINNVKKIIFKDKQQFEVFKKKYADKIECIYEPELKQGNYEKTLKIQGEYNKQYLRLTTIGYEKRVEQLSSLPENQKEKELIMVSDDGSVTIESNPLLLNYKEKYADYEKLLGEIDYAKDEKEEYSLLMRPFSQRIIMKPNDVFYIAEIERIKDIPKGIPFKDIPARITSIVKMNYEQIVSASKKK